MTSVLGDLPRGPSASSSWAVVQSLHTWRLASLRLSAPGPTGTPPASVSKRALVIFQARYLFGVGNPHALIPRSPPPPSSTSLLSAGIAAVTCKCT